MKNLDEAEKLAVCHGHLQQRKVNKGNSAPEILVLRLGKAHRKLAESEPL